MLVDLFQELGLTQNEAKIYESLVQGGVMNVSQIALKSTIHRRSVYDALNRLVEKGLISQIINKAENSYQAVDPVKFLELIKEKENKIKTALPELRRQYFSREIKEMPYLYQNVEGFKNYLRDFLRLSEDIFLMGNKKNWFDPQVKPFILNFLAEITKKQLKINALFSGLAEEEINLFPKNLLNYKILPLSLGELPAVDICGYYVITYSSLKEQKMNDQAKFYIVSDSRLAQNYRQLFKFIWTRI